VCTTTNIGLIKHTATLLADLAFHLSVDSILASDIEACSNKVILSINSMLLSLASTAGGSRSAKGKGKVRVRSVRPTDQLIQRAVCRNIRPRALLLTCFTQDIALNQFSGRTKSPPVPRKKAVAKRRQKRIFRISRSRSSSSSGRSTT
jgi:hypothetical protein